MKRLVVIILTGVFCAGRLFAQVDSLFQTDSLFHVPDSLMLAPEGFEYKDSIVYIPVSRFTDSLKGKDVFEMMSGKVVINQSPALESAARQKIDSDFVDALETEGYRIRIFFDNRQDAREESEKAQKRFEKLYPGYSTYRTFIYPNFKVTVGDFRTKAEAQVALKHIVKSFPNAFVVKERMKFPVIDQNELYTVDTVRVLAPIKLEIPLEEKK